MALYDYDCATCGPFELARPMAESARPAHCPSCGRTARRVFTPPGLRLLERPLRSALDHEEKSAHQPEVSTSKRGRPLHAHHHHGSAAQPWALSHH